MTTRTEEQRTVLIAERRVVRIGSDGVRARLLLGEADIILDAELLLIVSNLLSHLLLEQFQMVVRDGEMDVGIAVGAGIESSLYEMLLHRSPSSY